jgi:heat shock protein HslJ
MLKSLTIATIAAFAAITPLAAQPAEQSSPAPASNRLENTNWQAISWQENGAKVTIVPQSTITANFSNQKIGGSTGCNLYSAKYKLQGEKFSIEQPITTTKRACTKELGEQESRVLNALAGAEKLKIDRRGRLVLGYKSTSASGMITLVKTK